MLLEGGVHSDAAEGGVGRGGHVTQQAGVEMWQRRARVSEERRQILTDRQATEQRLSSQMRSDQGHVGSSGARWLV